MKNTFDICKVSMNRLFVGIFLAISALGLPTDAAAQPAPPAGYEKMLAATIDKGNKLGYWWNMNAFKTFVNTGGLPEHYLPGYGKISAVTYTGNQLDQATPATTFNLNGMLNGVWGRVTATQLTLTDNSRKVLLELKLPAGGAATFTSKFVQNSGSAYLLEYWGLLTVTGGEWFSQGLVKGNVYANVRYRTTYYQGKHDIHTTNGDFILYTPADCGDKIDNDGDGKIDFPADPGCDSITDRTEENPLLSVKKTVAQFVNSGSEAVYTYTVKNIGQATAKSVTMTDFNINPNSLVKINPLFDFVRSSNPGCGYNASARSVVCDLGNLAAGATRTINLTFNVPTFSNLCQEQVMNQVNVNVTPLDSKVSDFDRATTTVRCLPTPTATPRTTPVVVDTPTPTRTPTSTPTSTRTPVPPTATPTRTPVAPTATPTRTPVVPTPTATKTPVPPTATPTKTATPVSTPKLKIFKTIDPTIQAGGFAIYKFTVRNIGNGVAYGVATWDEFIKLVGDKAQSIESPLQYDSASSTGCAWQNVSGSTVKGLLCSLGNLNPGEEISYTATFRVPDSGALCGQVVMNQADAHVTPTDKNAADWVKASTTVNCAPPPTATATATKTATATRTPVPPTLTPTATATRTPVPPTATPTRTPVAPTATPTSTPVVPTPTATKTPVPPTATPTKTATPVSTPKLKILKTIDPSIQAGGLAVYKFTVKNIGSGVAYGVATWDEFIKIVGDKAQSIESPLQYDSASSTGCAWQNVSGSTVKGLLCSLGNLNPGEETSYTATFRVPDGSALCGQVVMNQADAHVTPTDKNAADWVKASTTVNCAPTPTATATATNTATATRTPVPPTLTPTATATSTNTPVVIVTNTPAPTATATSTSTNTPVPPTATPTRTQVPPTATPTAVPPTRTPTSTPTPTNTPKLPQCSDRIDNDGDGFIDYPLDPGCESPTDDIEQNTPNPVTPSVTCVLDNGDGSVTAFFGYVNSAQAISIAAGTNTSQNINALSPGNADQGQPDLFQAGAHDAAFSVTFPSSQSLTWSIKYQGSSKNSVTAKKGVSKECIPVSPIVECVDQKSAANYTARFGYENQNGFNVPMPIGQYNLFTPTPGDRGQPDLFFTGVVKTAFTIDFDGSDLTWKLGVKAISASKSSKPCNPNQPPTCNPGGNYSKSCQGDLTTVKLDGSASKDPEGKALSYKWSSTCSDVAIDSATSATPTLSLFGPGKGNSAQCTVILVVSDGVASSSCEAPVSVPACDNTSCQGGTGHIDQCGVCNGNGQSCLGCDGVVNSGKTLDVCGVCGGNNACIGCDGQPNSSKKADVCGVCGGDGTSCLQCSDSNIRNTLFALDSNAKDQAANAKSALRRLSNNAHDNATKKYVAQAKADIEKLSARAWETTWSIPQDIKTCAETSACSLSDNSVKINDYNSNASALRDSTQKTLRLLRTVRGGQLRKSDKKIGTAADRLYDQALALSSSVPRFQSVCR